MISLFDLLFLGALALVAIYLYLSWNFNYWTKRGVDCDDNISVIFGSLKDSFFGKKPFGSVFTDIYNKYKGKKVVGWYKFRKPGLIIRDPELIRKILVNDFNSFRNNDVAIDPDADPIMGRNIFVLRDELWKKNRALITPAFTAGKIKAMYPSMGEVGNELVRYLKENPGEIHVSYPLNINATGHKRFWVKVKSMMSRYTSEIVARCAFGIEGNNLKDSRPEMYELGKLIFDPSLLKNLKIMAFFMTPKLVKLLRLKMVPDNVINFFDGVLRDVIVHRQKNNIVRNDLVSYLIEVKKKTIEVAKGNLESDLVTRVYTDEDVLSGCIMFFVEGYETSAVILNNVLHQLAINKDVQDQLRNEIDEVLQEGELTFDKLHSMNYLHKVYAETNRVLPATYSLQKICTERYEMDIGTGKPLVIEEDTPIVIPLYGIHKDPLYWDDPEKFDPERFSDKEEALAKSKGVYLPFSDGPRICPGSRIATTIVKLAVVKIVSELEILPTSRTPQKIEEDPNYFMIAHKGGIYLRFVERSR